MSEKFGSSTLRQCDRDLKIGFLLTFFSPEGEGGGRAQRGSTCPGGATTGTGRNGAAPEHEETDPVGSPETHTWAAGGKGGNGFAVPCRRAKTASRSGDSKFITEVEDPREPMLPLRPLSLSSCNPGSRDPREPMLPLGPSIPFCNRLDSVCNPGLWGSRGTGRNGAAPVSPLSPLVPFCKRSVCNPGSRSPREPMLPLGPSIPFCKRLDSVCNPGRWGPRGPMSPLSSPVPFCSLEEHNRTFRNVPHLIIF